MRINNNNFQKNSNISRVVETIWHKQQISRIDISRELELYRSTVSNIINSLISNGFVLETEEGTSLPQGGRKPIYLSINQSFGCVIGLELQPSHYHAVVVNLFGEVLFSYSSTIPEYKSISNHSFNTEATFLSMMDQLYSTLLPKIKEIGIPPLALCVGMPGIIDTDKGIVINSTPFLLKNFNFYNVFDMRYGLPVLLENDANCCAWFDMTSHRQSPLKDFVTVLAEYHELPNSNIPEYSVRTGMGVGLSLVIDNKVRYGHNYSTGEYYSPSWRKGCSGQTGIPHQQMIKILSDDSVFQTWITEIFLTLSSITPILSPECLILHGEPFGNKEHILSIIADKVPQFNLILEMSDCELKFSPVNAFQIAEGAASMFLQKLFSVPNLSETDSILRFDWDYIFDIVNNSHIQRKN